MFCKWTTKLSLKVGCFTKQTLERGESHCWERKCSVQKFGAMNKATELGKWQAMRHSKGNGGAELAPRESWVNATTTYPVPQPAACKVTQDSVRLLHAPFRTGQHPGRTALHLPWIFPFPLFPSLQLLYFRFSPAPLIAYYDRLLPDLSLLTHSRLLV